MSTLISYSILALIGLIYTLLMGKKLSYITAPDNLLHSDDRIKILKTHTFISLILGIAISVKVLPNYLENFTEDMNNHSSTFYFTLLFVFIISFIIVGYLIEVFLKLTSESYRGMKTVIDNIETLQPSKEYIIDESMEPEEFWKLIGTKENTLEQVSNSIRNLHPRKIVMAINLITKLKQALKEKDIQPIYGYLFRKIDEHMYQNFTDYLICKGQADFKNILDNPDLIGDVEINSIKIFKFSLLDIFINEFEQQTSTLCPIPDTLINPKPKEIRTSWNSVKDKFPKIDSKY